MKKAIIIYGPPGSGKGTQANLLASNLGFVHFDTGRYLEKIVHDPANVKNKIIQRERKNFDTGILMTPSWVLEIVTENTKKLAAVNSDIVFSGSPRTMFEAFGDSKHISLIKTLEKLYGKKNIKIIYIDVSAKTSIFRNSHRTVCPVCDASVLYKKGAMAPHCPICASPVKKRTLDKPEIIKVRLKEYKQRTFPILRGLKKLGYKINFIKGEQPPYKVFKNILFKLRLNK